MTVFWGLILALPLLVTGGGIVFAGKATDRIIRKFEASRRVAGVLTVVAWFWTAYECHTIGIDVFDMLLKIFPGQLWLMAAGLSYLTIIWMPDHLSVRALTAILMLFPASLFRTTRLLTPDSGFAMVHILVVTGYVAAVIGMYGMFYPWRYEKAYDLVAARPKLRQALGWVLMVWGAAVLTAGIAI